MRPWTVCSVLCAALLVLAGLSVGQTQGPLKDPGATVGKSRKAADPEKKGETELPKIPSAYSKKDKPQLSGDLATFQSNVDIVTVDVAVLDNKGHFIPGIPPGNFRILEDNVPQKIGNVTMGEAPITVALVIEFSNLFQQYWSYTWYQTLQAAFGFISTLKPEDYLAVIAYDLKPEILSDFSTDRRMAQEAMRRLNIPAFSESNLYDAITDTADRMSGIEGRKAIVVLASGIDTFSKLTFDQTRKSLQQSGVPIYAIGLMQQIRELYDARGMMGSIQRMDFLQADNQMRTFAKETGGQSFFPRFEGEMPAVFQTIHQAMRNQYVISYQPSNSKHDGTFRKIKVELVNPATNEPLPVKDEKGKPIKYTILAKGGYKAPRVVE
jgi:Ca-activated chloride channel family protein